MVTICLQIPLSKSLKKVRQQFGLNSLTGIKNANLGLLSHPLEFHLYAPAARRELDRVVD